MLLRDYTLIRCLGKGSFGEVFLTSKQGSSERFATKRISKKHINNPKAKQYIDNEINILKEIDHPNIIKLIDIVETTQFYNLVMELCNGGELSKCLEQYKAINKRAFSEEIVQHLMKQIVSSINYLHQKNILHRDIKLENILVNFDSEEDKNNLNMLKAKIKLIDFGFARHLSSNELAFSTLGSPINMDPGILRKLNRMAYSKNYGYDQKADIWSLGTICYEMLVGKNAFNAESMKELLKKVEKGNYYLPKSLSREVVSFLNGMLQYDPKKRLSSDQLYHHKFLTKPFSELVRIDLNKAQNHLKGSKIEISSKNNQSIWVIFEGEENSLDQISMDMIEEDMKSPQVDRYINMKVEKKKEKNQKDANLKHISEDDIKKEFLSALIDINDDFIYIEPKLIPIIPGDDPTVINKVSQFSEDDYS